MTPLPPVQTSLIFQLLIFHRSPDPPDPVYGTSVMERALVGFDDHVANHRELLTRVSRPDYCI